MQKILVALCTLFTIVSSSQLYGQNEEVRWMTWEEVEAASKVEQRKVFVYMHTTWCSWCKKMEGKTLSEPNIVAYLNENYYNVNFDAQHREDITFKGKVYQLVRAGRHNFNELAIEITMGKMSFPSIVFMDENLNVIQPIPAYQGPQKFEKLMTYFAGDFHKTTPWREYEHSYNSRYYVPASMRGH